MSDLLHDSQVKRALEAARAGAFGTVASVDLVCALVYPPYEGGPLPPWSTDAGYPVRDVGVHGFLLIQQLLGPIVKVDAVWRSLGNDPNLAFDDWSINVHCERGTGRIQLTTSDQGPIESHLVIHGSKAERRIALAARATTLPDAVERVAHKVADSFRPLLKLARKAPPADGVSGSAVSVDVWVDDLARTADEDHRDQLAKLPRSERVAFLVTGATGSLGRAVVKRLRARGHQVRAFVRRVPKGREPGLEHVVGNLGDPDAVDRAVQGAEVVIHCGAAMKGDWAEHQATTVMGTQHVVDACQRHGVKQLVHISSMSVVDWAGSADHGPITEAAPLEPRPTERGAYTRAKLEAEQLVTAAVARGLPAVILRPGQIFGGGIPLINGAVARNARGRWLVLGDGKLELPLVYIDDVVDAILKAVEKQLVGGEVIQIVDPERLTQEEVLELAGADRPIVRVPRPVVFALGRLSELPLGAIGKQSPIGVYRLKSAMARLAYGSGRAGELLGWQPRVGVREGIRRVARA